MSNTFNLSAIEEALKVQYAENMANLIPEMAPILSKAKMISTDKKLGKSYEQPVILSKDQGFSCFGNADQNVDFNEPINHNIKDVSFKSTAYGARSWITRTALARAASSPQAFITNTSYYIESLVSSFSHMIEGENWYGRSGLATGTIAAVSGATAQLRVSAAEAAPFLFLGGEGMKVDVYVGGVFKIEMTITALDLISSDAGTTQNGGITIYMTTSSGSNIVAEIANADTATIFRKGFEQTTDAASSHFGLKKILTQASMFGLDGAAANSSLWKPNYADVGGQALTYTLLSKYVAQSLARGLSGPLAGYVRSIAYRQLFPDVDTIGSAATVAGGTVVSGKRSARKVNDAASAKSFAHGTKEVSIVVDSIEITMNSTEFVKGGDCFLLDMGAISLVGSTKPEFGMPGSPDSFLLPVPNKNVYEIRCWSDVSPFTEARNKHLLLTNIGGL